MSRAGLSVIAAIAIGCGGRAAAIGADGGTVSSSSASASGCGQSLDDYCAANACVRDFGEASKGDAWCRAPRQLASISDAPCGGLAVVTYSPSSDDALGFYYDMASGRLVGVTRADGIAEDCVASAPGFARDPSCSFATRVLCDTF